MERCKEKSEKDSNATGIENLVTKRRNEKIQGERVSVT
jgi:hypothetical protein